MEGAVSNWGSRHRANQANQANQTKPANMRYASRKVTSNVEIAARKERNRARQAGLDAYSYAAKQAVKAARYPPPPRRPEGWVRPEGSPPPRSLATERRNSRNSRNRRRRSRRRRNTRRCNY